MSLSIPKTLFELPATIDIGTNRVTPLAVMPCARPCDPRGWFASFTFHCCSNPGFDKAAREILSSVRTHDVRCASASAVSHCEPPRPGCAKVIAPAQTVTDVRTANIKR